MPGSKCVTIFILTLIGSLNAASLRSNQACHEDANSISCTHNNIMHWDFRDFRKGTDRILDKDIFLNITCNSGGEIFLPWPMKARNLKKITIQNCLLKGYFSEFTETQKYPDSLTDISISNCAIETEIYEMIQRSLHLNSTSKSYNCGQETVVNYAVRNMTYVFKSLANPPSMQLLSEAFEAIKEHSKLKLHTCNFNNMVNLDQSISYSRSKIYFDTLTDRSFYPALRFFNFSTNLMPKIPPQLHDWSMYFPSLEELDLSNNHLQSFNFAPSVSAASRKLLVNLQNNFISRIPQTLMSLLRADSQIFVDLRNNPIDCSCNVGILKDYLSQVTTLDPSLQDLTKVKCTTPSIYYGRQVLNIQSDLRLC